MNLMNIFRAVKNPQQLIQQIAGNNQIMRNPMIQNVMQISQISYKNFFAKNIMQIF